MRVLYPKSNRIGQSVFSHVSRRRTALAKVVEIDTVIDTQFVFDLSHDVRYTACSSAKTCIAVNRSDFFKRCIPNIILDKT